jgi:hypothetical protein
MANRRQLHKVHDGDRRAFGGDLTSSTHAFKSLARSAENETINQLDADLAFELTDLVAQRGLGHMQALCRTTKMEFFGHNDEVTQMPNLDHRGAPRVGGQNCRTFYHHGVNRKPNFSLRQSVSS